MRYGWISLLALVLLFSCTQQPEKPPLYEKSDTTTVQVTQSFIYNSDKDSLFEDFIADVLDKSKLVSLQTSKIKCVHHSSKDRNATEIIGQNLNLWLKNDADSISRLVINGKGHEIEGFALSLKCESLRNFSFNGKQYTYFIMVHNDVLYDHEHDEITMFAASDNYFPFGDIDGDGRLDHLTFNADQTEATVYSQQENGTFELLKNDKDEPSIMKIRLYRDTENGLYQIDILTNPPFLHFRSH